MPIRQSAILLLACLFSIQAMAELVVPIASVEDSVNIRLYPDPSSERVGILLQGDSAPLVRSFDGWYEVEIAGGATGFISAEWTAVVDALPDAVAETRAPGTDAELGTVVAESALQPES